MTWDPKQYDKRWAEMAAAGQDPHGEVAFVERFMRRSDLGSGSDSDAGPAILDAGCGTGRVAIELDRRGYQVAGSDVDQSMLAEARAKAPHLPWDQGDLASTDLGRQFDLIVLAGNVILFVEPSSRPFVAVNLRRHLHVRGVVVAGFQLARPDGRRVPLREWDTWMDNAGFSLIERYSTWDDEPWDPHSDYVVSVHRLL
jgi:2-polyprenyl-3-methyl-5-hydroxy-6-metoxy-1,4-benzoquinol methylase